MGKERLQVSLLLFFSAGLFVYGSYHLPFLGPDEPRYSQIARQMAESGDYIVPHLGPFVWFEKPVLLYWMMAAFYAIFGVNEFAARFPSALSALAAVFVLYSTVRRVAGATQAVFSGLILATTAFFVGFSHAATFDMLLTLMVTASLCLFLFAEVEPDQPKYMYGAYLFLGLGILAKGLIAPTIIILTIAGYTVLSKKWNITRWRPLRGSLIVLAVCGIWFLPVSVLYGWRFWDEFVYQHHIVRYTSSYYHRAGNAFYYIPVLLLGTFPWTLAPLLKRPAASTPERGVLIRLSLCWLFLCVIFFSFSQSKLPGYILPAVPAFAILAGLSLGDLFQNRLAEKRRVLILFGWNAVIAIILFFRAQGYPPASDVLRYFAGILMFFSLVAAFLAWRRSLIPAMAAQTAVMLGALIIGIHWLPVKLNWYESRQLSLQALPYLTDGKRLVFYNVYDFGPLFYTNARIELTPEGYLYNVPNDRQLYRYLNEKKEAFVVVGNEELTWIQDAQFWRVAEIIPGKENSIVHLQVR